MAHPFSATTLGKYIRWAADSAGCTVQTGYRARHPLVKIISADGKRMVVLSMEQNDILDFAMVDHLDRKLGVTSPFPKS